ncbi:glycosyltransferase family 4 protein [Candidatus Raskinella chloraquaticus]|uniref:glycosyltransferase family 4 protein n=1 Tax=Candidatus Raskinella chloraquaticus TaxID=1951219 RepID=UPI00366B17FD
MHGVDIKPQKKAVLILLPFAVEGSLIVRIARALRARGEPILCMIQQRETGAYKSDELADFAETGDLVDLSKHNPDTWRAVLIDVIASRSIGALLQLGAYLIYPLLGFLKQDIPGLRVADMLYNPVGHMVRHSIYEGAIDCVFVESAYMREVVAASTRIPNRTIEVLCSGIDLAAFVPLATRPPRPLTLGFVGRFSEEKGPLDFIALADRLTEGGCNAQFAVFGSGPMEGAMRSRCASSPAADRIAFHGYVDDVRQAFAAIDVLVLPSRADGRPVAVMEAAASGVPVIAAPVGGIPEMIEDGVNGWIARPNQFDRIGALVTELERDPARLAKLRADARAYAERHFDENRMLDAYATAFRRLADQQKPVDFAMVAGDQFVLSERAVGAGLA